MENEDFEATLNSKGQKKMSEVLELIVKSISLFSSI